MKKIMKTYRMWIILQLSDFDCRNVVADKVNGTVQEMGGEVVKSGGLGDICVVAAFSHRKYRNLEKAVAAALNTLPVQRTIVTGQDPYILRPKTIALTMELYRRQDEVVGL
jgi:hypothetical protein